MYAQYDMIETTEKLSSHKINCKPALDRYFDFTKL